MSNKVLGIGGSNHDFSAALVVDGQLFVAIEDVARTHLALAEARNAWRRALEGSGLTLEQRDELERSALQVQSVSDTAYFYAGLAFGLAFTCFCRSI